MDLNYFLRREQVERMRADVATCAESRLAHTELAQMYRKRIDDHRGARLASESVEPDARLLVANVVNSVA